MGKILCFFGLHDWLISKWVKFKDKKCKVIYEEGFNRCCLRCNKEQTLQESEEYHPIKYVWGKKLE